MTLLVTFKDHIFTPLHEEKWTNVCGTCILDLFFIWRNYTHLNWWNFCLPTWWPLLMPLFLLVHIFATIWYAIKGNVKRYCMVFMTLIQNMWIGHSIKSLEILNIGNHSFCGRLLFWLVFVVVGSHSLVPFFIFL